MRDKKEKKVKKIVVRKSRDYSQVQPMLKELGIEKEIFKCKFAWSWKWNFC